MPGPSEIEIRPLYEWLICDENLTPEVTEIHDRTMSTHPKTLFKERRRIQQAAAGMVEAFGKLPTQSAILDGELCHIDPRGSAHFYLLMAQMRTSDPDESQLMFMAFDLLLHQDGVDLRALTLFEGPRKPELTEAQTALAKKREELARVLVLLRTPGLRQGLRASCAST